MSTAPDWAGVRRSLFGGPRDVVVTVVSSLVAAYVLYRLGRFVFVTGRWEIVQDNLTLFLVGRYPRGDLWRPALALVSVAGYGGLLAGWIHARQVQAGRHGGTASPRHRVQELTARLWPALVGVLGLLLLARTAPPWLVAVGAAVAAAAGNLAGRRLPRRALAGLIGAGVAGTVALLVVLAQPLGWDAWGGLMLNVVLAVASIALCFPLGVLLALGRRSKLPLIRAVCVAYIELFRGVPLFVLLLMAGIALGFFVPSSVTPGLVVRAIVVFTLFTAAYVAEIVRGGLQSLPRGQVEAGRALGLSPTRVTFLIVLPQALRNVIPALVGQFISLFKDTTLAGAAMGFLELLGVSQAVPQQPGFRGQGLFAETLVFAMALFWVGSITMSRESQRLERKLGVGTR